MAGRASASPGSCRYFSFITDTLKISCLHIKNTITLHSIHYRCIHKYTAAYTEKIIWNVKNTPYNILCTFILNLLTYCSKTLDYKIPLFLTQSPAYLHILVPSSSPRVSFIYQGSWMSRSHWPCCRGKVLLMSQTVPEDERILTDPNLGFCFYLMKLLQCPLLHTLTSSSSILVFHFSRFILLMAHFSFRGIHSAEWTTAVAPIPGGEKQREYKQFKISLCPSFTLSIPLYLNCTYEAFFH